MGCVGVKEWGQLTSDDSLASPQNQTFNIRNYVGFSREQVLRQAGPPFVDVNMMPYVWVATRLKCHSSFQTSYKDKSWQNCLYHYREGQRLKMGVLEVLSLFIHGGRGGPPETSGEAYLVPTRLLSMKPWCQWYWFWIYESLGSGRRWYMHPC